MTILKTIAEKLGVVETEAAVLEAIDQHVTLREQMGKNLGLEKTTGMRVLLRAAVDNEAVRGKYVAILGALGVENPEQGLDRIAEMIQQAEQLKKLAPEFEALRVKQAKLEEAEAEADVDEVMAERKWTDKGLRICLLEKRKSSVEEFRKLYPKPEPDKVHLTKQVVDKGAGVDAASGGKVIKLSAYAGRNRTERAMAFVKANVAGADQFTFEELHEQGCRLLHSGQVED